MPQNTTQKYSNEVLEETPPRAAKLLNGIGAVPVIRTLMLQVGMTEDDIAEGSKLLLACWSQLPGTKTEKDTEEARKQREAVAELDQWDEPHFTRFSATLQRHYPSAGDYVFHNLAASTGIDAVAGVSTFLTRLDALEKGTDPQRADSKKDDKKAVALLAARGLDKDERDRLASLVEVALRPTTALADPPQDEGARAAARIQALTALKDWYEEWATAARTVVKKRSYLIRMGLASRKSPRKDASAPGNGKGTGPSAPGE